MTESERERAVLIEALKTDHFGTLDTLPGPRPPLGLLSVRNEGPAYTELIGVRESMKQVFQLLFTCPLPLQVTA
jgi:hypothetical protein